MLFQRSCRHQPEGLEWRPRVGSQPHPREAPGHRPLSLRRAAFNGWTRQRERGESPALGTPKKSARVAEATVLKPKVPRRSAGRRARSRERLRRLRRLVCGARPAARRALIRCAVRRSVPSHLFLTMGTRCGLRGAPAASSKIRGREALAFNTQNSAIKITMQQRRELPPSPGGGGSRAWSEANASGVG